MTKAEVIKKLDSMSNEAIIRRDNCVTDLEAATLDEIESGLCELMDELREQALEADEYSVYELTPHLRQVREILGPTTEAAARGYAQHCNFRGIRVVVRGTVVAVAKS